MSDHTAINLTLEFLETRRIASESEIAQLESEIAQLEAKLVSSRQQYSGFLDLINLLRSPAPEELSSRLGKEMGQGFDENDENCDESFNDINQENSTEFFDAIESSPRDWLLPEYKNFQNMEEIIFAVLPQCQPAKPRDIASRIYQIDEGDPRFQRARNSVTACLTAGKRSGKWKVIKRGAYVLNSYPESFNTGISRNEHYINPQAF